MIRTSLLVIALVSAFSANAQEPQDTEGREVPRAAAKELAPSGTPAAETATAGTPTEEAPADQAEAPGSAPAASKPPPVASVRRGPSAVTAGTRVTAVVGGAVLGAVGISTALVGLNLFAGCAVLGYGCVITGIAAVPVGVFLGGALGAFAGGHLTQGQGRLGNTFKWAALGSVVPLALTVASRVVLNPWLYMALGYSLILPVAGAIYGYLESHEHETSAPLAIAPFATRGGGGVAFAGVF